MGRTILITAADEDTVAVREQLREREFDIVFCPLERYVSRLQKKKIRKTFEELDTFENIVYGSRRNAQFFVAAVGEYGCMEEVQECLNLTADADAADYLEEHGIPVVHPDSAGKSIDLLEFLLRVRRMGPTLYPCGDKTNEDFPGLLRELDIPVCELVLFTLEGPEEGVLKQYREMVASADPAVVVFHSRRSVNRTLAAFPDLNYSVKTVLTADQGITDKLAGEGIEVTAQAGGSWQSIVEKAEEIL